MFIVWLYSQVDILIKSNNRMEMIDLTLFAKNYRQKKSILMVKYQIYERFHH